MCLTEPALFDGYDVSPDEYLVLLRHDSSAQLASQQTLEASEFIAAHRLACEDIADGVIEVVPRGLARYALQDDEMLGAIQTDRQYTWSGFFDVYLPDVFAELREDDELWRNATNLTFGEIPKRKRAKLDTMKSRDRVAKAAKCAAYLAIATFAHDDKPIETRAV